MEYDVSDKVIWVDEENGALSFGFTYEEVNCDSISTI